MQRGSDDYHVRDRHAAHSEGHGVGAAASARYNLLCSLNYTIPHSLLCTRDNTAGTLVLLLCVKLATSERTV